MRLSKILVVSLLTSLCFQTAFGQQHQVSVQLFGSEQGLAHHSARGFHKDTRGFIWMGSKAGLHRFDGKQFKVYTKESHGLWSNNVYSITEDEQGVFWLLHTGDFKVAQTITLFDPIEEKTIDLSHAIEKPLPFEVEQMISLSYKPKFGMLFILNDGTIYQYLNKQMRLFTKVDFELPPTFLIWHNTEESLWLASLKKLVQINQKGEVLATIHTTYFIKSLFGTDQAGNPFYYAIERRFADSKATLFLGKKKLAKLPNPFLLVIAVDSLSKQVVLAHTKRKFHGLILSDFEGNILKQGDKLLTFTSNNLLFLRPEIWHNSNFHGAMLIKSSPLKFRKYLHDITTVYGLRYGTRGIQQFGNTLMVNGLGYSYQVNLTTGDYKPFTKDLYLKEMYQESLCNGLAMLKDSKNRLWMSDERTQLLQYNSQKESFNYYNYPKKFREAYQNESHDIRGFKIKPIMQWALYEEPNKRIWIGHNSGLSYLDLSANHLSYFEPSKDFESLKKNTVYYFHKHKKGIWLATSNGLYLFDTNKGVQAHYHENGEGKYKLPHNYIVHIHEDSAGYFWLASKGGGLIKWHPETFDIKQFTTQEGLSDNVIYAIYEDDFEKLWISSNKGIMRFDKNSYEINTYLPEDGLSDKEFNTISHYKAADGTLFFGSVNGITSFHPKDFILSSKTSYPIQITSLKKQNRNTGKFEEITAKVSKTHQIELLPSDLGFVLEFAYLNFNTRKTQYAYKIEGLDQDWNYLSIPQVRISSLPYGTYNLTIKAQGELGLWENAYEIPVIQRKPFYLELWFIALAVALICLIILIYIKYQAYRHQQEQVRLENIITQRTAIIEQQANELKALDKAKSKFFANISHELRTPLTLVLGPVYQLLEKKQAGDDYSLLLNAKRNGESLQQMINGILDLSRLESNKLIVKKEATEALAYFRLLVTNFNSQAQFQGIDYQFNASIPHQYYLLLDREKVGQIMNNLLSNALKFTKKGGHILTSIWVENQILYIAIKDSGKGISEQDLPHIFDRYFQSHNPTAQGGSGIGLALARELALLMHGNLVVESNFGKGTTFTFSLPIQEADEEIVDIADNQILIEEIDFIREEIVLPFPKKQLTVLVVEDHPDMQQFIIGLLQNDYQIKTANNGLEALDFLSAPTANPDLIITDVMMPEFDGFGLLERVKKSDDWRGIPIIMLTARAAEEDKLQALTIGVDDYLTKPFSPAELRVRVSNLLNNYQLRKAWQTTVLSKKNKQDQTEETEFAVKEVDLLWIAEVKDNIQQQLHNEGFTLQDAAEQHNLSFRQFQRRVKKITGLSPKKYQQEIQLQLARELLEKGTFRSVAEVAFSVGFTTTDYFSKLYIARFGKKPSSYKNP